jgi:hypothetical protein
MKFTTKIVYKFEDEIPFGKYRGEKFVHIMAKDVEYVRFLHEVAGVNLDEKILKCLKCIKRQFKKN